MVEPKISRRRSLSGLASLALAPLAPTLLGCHGKSQPQTRVGPVADTTITRAPVQRVIESMAAIDGDGATVQRIFPSPHLRHFDPFVLLDDFNVRAPAGFPMHPHRGFEAFTYMIEGAFHHRDTMGNDSKVSAGGTQRFTSGKGARHSEMPGTPGSNRGLQLWVNLPRRLKKIDPEYAATHGDGMPMAEHNGQRTRTIVGAGSPVSLRTEVEYSDVQLLADGSFSRSIPQGRNTLVYALSGELRLGDTTIHQGQGALIGAGDLTAEGAAGARFAFLSGHPHDEPILHRGPFVD